MPSKASSNNITSYDLLKGLALLLMFVDHIGHHFYLENLDLRVVGRLCVPIWFFLIGYANSREVPKSWWIYGVLLTIASMMSGQYVFPLSILFTLGITRLWIDGTARRALKGLESLAGMYFLLFLLSIPSMGILEYGTAGLLFALYGLFRRHREDLLLKPWVMFLFILGCIVAFIVNQLFVMPEINWSQLGVLLFGLVGVCGLLFVFSPKSYPRLTKMLGPLSHLVRFMGRWTLEIYVVHLLIFRGLAVYLYPDKFVFLSFQIAPPGFLSMFVMQ